jgi:hypothetical protein
MHLKNPTPSSSFLKVPLTNCNYFNLIELSTPEKGAHNKKQTREKNKNFKSFVLPKFPPINPIVPPPNFIN